MMRVAAPDELSAVLLRDRLRPERCELHGDADGSWYVEYGRPATPAHAAVLTDAVRRWLVEERIERTIIWINDDPLAITV
jgi:hypothetical protein